MTLTEKINAYLWSSYLYYRLDRSPIRDSEFDQICKDLLLDYPELPEDFRARIGEGDLRAGTGFFLHFSQDEIEDALNWEEGIINLEGEDA